MRIKMLRTERGSVDGVRVAVYRAGEEYDLASPGGRDLATAFIGAGVAVEIGEATKADAPPTNKAVAGAPENKAPLGLPKRR